MKNNNLGVGDRIRQRREELNLTQTQLAERMGYTSKTSICKVERGDDNITADRISKFAIALNTTESFLMGWEDEPQLEFPDISPKHIEFLDKFSKLTPSQQQLILNTIDALLSGNN